MIDRFHIVHTSAHRQQLKALGVKPEAVEYLVMSHGHFDHTGNANDFGKATLICSNTARVEVIETNR